MVQTRTTRWCNDRSEIRKQHSHIDGAAVNLQHPTQTGVGLSHRAIAAIDQQESSFLTWYSQVPLLTDRGLEPGLSHVPKQLQARLSQLS